MHKCDYCKELKEYTEKTKENKQICMTCKGIVNKKCKIIVNKKERGLLTPVKIKNKLDKFVIKQDDAKIILATEAYNHLKRTNIKELDDIEKNNILLVGPSGSGKTYLVETLSKIIDVPMVCVSATEFTATGYVGKNVTAIGKYLLEKAGGDKAKAEKGIVFIDEIDKIAGCNDSLGNKDVGGIEVQKELLKLIEGEELHLNEENGLFDDLEPELTLNTKNILFIFSGAFENLRNNDETKINLLNNKDESKAHEITSDLLVKNGFLREFVGRIPIIAEIDKLEIKDIVDILTKAENNLISQYTKMFAYDGIDLKFTDGAIHEIAKTSYDKNVGARGLKSILGNLMNKMLYKVYEKKNSELKITKKDVENANKKNDKKNMSLL